MPEDPQKLVVLRFGPWQESTKDVYAYTADLGPGPELEKVVFGKPTQLKPKKGSEVRPTGVLTYDDERKELLFGTTTDTSKRDTSSQKTDPATAESESNIKVWHIGKNLKLDRQEPISIHSTVSPKAIALLLERKLINVAFSGYSREVKWNEGKREGKNENGPWISRKGTDGKWRPVPLRAAGEKLIPSSLHFTPIIEDAGHVHLIGTDGTSPQWAKIVIYSMPIKQFADLAINDKAEWQRNKVSSGWDVTHDVASLVIHDASHNNKKLYFFGPGPEGRKASIQFSSIPLEKDCSVASSGETNIKASDKTVITLPSSGEADPPKVVRWQDKVLIFSEGKESFHVLSGQIGADGSLPAADDWKVIEAEFESKPDSRGDQSFGGAALVPADFVKTKTEAGSTAPPDSEPTRKQSLVEKLKPGSKDDSATSKSATNSSSKPDPKTDEKATGKISKRKSIMKKIKEIVKS